MIEAEKGKEKREGGKCEKVVGIKYLPMAVDTFGGFGPNAMGAMERVANEMRVAKDMDPQVSTKRLAQKLRVVVMSHVANKLLRRSKFSCDEKEMQKEVEELTRELESKVVTEEEPEETEEESEGGSTRGKGEVVSLSGSTPQTEEVNQAELEREEITRRTEQETKAKKEGYEKNMNAMEDDEGNGKEKTKEKEKPGNEKEKEKENDKEKEKEKEKKEK